MRLAFEAMPAHAQLYSGKLGLPEPGRPNR